MTRYAKRTDANQAALVAELRQLGMSVYGMSHIGHGIPDLIVCWRGACRWVEVKTADGTLTQAERAFIEICPGPPVLVARRADDVLKQWEES